MLLARTPAALPPRHGLPVLEHGVDVALAAQMAEAVGLMDQLVAMPVEYTNTHRQFGVSIASFQALRHGIADVKMPLEPARSMSCLATLELGEPEAARRRAVRRTRVLGQSMHLVGQQRVQLHGGIACTDEYAASHYFNRAADGAGDDLRRHAAPPGRGQRAHAGHRRRVCLSQPDAPASRGLPALAPMPARAHTALSGAPWARPSRETP